MCDFCSCQLFVGSEVSDLAMYQCNWRPSIYRLWFSLGPLKNRISESISDGADGIKSRRVLPFAVILYLATSPLLLHQVQLHLILLCHERIYLVVEVRKM